MNRPTATVIGDTSAFHQGADANYSSFRRLIAERYLLIQEIPYTEFGKAFLSYSEFCRALKRSKWWGGISESDMLVVHGEGLTEFHCPWVYPYLYFGRLATAHGKDSAIVNFSMFDVEPFAELLTHFKYIACRERETASRLSQYGFKPELSFDCIVLSHSLQQYARRDETVTAVRGRVEIDREILSRYPGIIKLNACWNWRDASALRMPTFGDYARRAASTNHVVTTSFHGIVLALLSGSPFQILSNDNPKYEALARELRPAWWDDQIFRSRLTCDSDLSTRLHSHYRSLWPSLAERARLNCPPLPGEMPRNSAESPLSEV